MTFSALADVVCALRYVPPFQSAAARSVEASDQPPAGHSANAWRSPFQHPRGKQQQLVERIDRLGLAAWNPASLNVPQEKIQIGIPAFQNADAVVLPKILTEPFRAQPNYWRFADGSEAPRRLKSSSPDMTR